MDNYERRLDENLGQSIGPQVREEEAFRRAPWYHPHYRVCPSCDKPIELSGLHELPPNISKPFGRHLGRDMPGLPPSVPEAKKTAPITNQGNTSTPRAKPVSMACRPDHCSAHRAV